MFVCIYYLLVPANNIHWLLTFNIHHLVFASLVQKFCPFEHVRCCAFSTFRYSVSSHHPAHFCTSSRQCGAMTTRMWQLCKLLRSVHMYWTILITVFFLHEICSIKIKSNNTITKSVKCKISRVERQDH